MKPEFGYSTLPADNGREEQVEDNNLVLPQDTMLANNADAPSLGQPPMNLLATNWPGQLDTFANFQTQASLSNPDAGGSLYLSPPPHGLPDLMYLQFPVLGTGLQQEGTINNNLFGQVGPSQQQFLPGGAFCYSGLDHSVFSQFHNSAMDCYPHPLPAEPVTKVEDKAATIPLICHLCPKKPKFSDVSHLLTHVSSKSHLHNVFKAEHSSKDEDKQALQQFQAWENHHGIKNLVSARVNAKAQKKQPIKRQRVAANEKKARNSTNALEDIKTEPNDNFHLQVDQNPLQATAWHLHTPRNNSFDDPYHVPSNQRVCSAYPLPDSPHSSTYIKQETSRSGTEATDISLPSEAPEVVGPEYNTTKLKGKVWPGMSLFDAANLDDRRMRNQKKHHSVLQNMILTSESIEQNELVWDQNMSGVTRTRNVYDSPSIDGSPDAKEEEPSSNKKRRSGRAFLTDFGLRRQTRASTRAAAKAKQGGRAGKPKKKGVMPEVDVDSDSDAASVPLAPRGRGVFGDSSDSVTMGDDIFQERHQARQETAGSPLGHHAFDLPFRFRPAMQSLPSNIPLNASSSIFDKSGSQGTFSYLNFGMRGNENMDFSLQQPSSIPNYFPQQRQNLQSSGLNPLCVQRPGNYSYLYGGPSFDNSKPSDTTFQSMNNMDYNDLDSASQLQPGNPHNNDFGI